MEKILLVCLISLGYSGLAHAQTQFPETFLGIWKGTMYIYKAGALTDSIQVKFTVEKTSDPGVYTWRTEYISDLLPMVKEYTLRLYDAEQNLYVIDEGNGIELKSHLIKNKLYSIFKTNDRLLTASYEVRRDSLIFEVTSGIALEENKGITNFSVTDLQRVVYKRIY